MQPESLVVPSRTTRGGRRQPGGVLSAPCSPSAAWRLTGKRYSSLAPSSFQRPASACFWSIEAARSCGLRRSKMRPQPSGRIDAELPDTPEGREAAALVQSGQRKGLSVEFFALSDKRVSQVREVRSAFIEATAAVSRGLLRPIESGAAIARGESVALTETEATAAATAAIDSYCVGSPAAIRTAAVARLSHWIARYPADSIASVSHSDQSGELAEIRDGIGDHAERRRGLTRSLATAARSSHRGGAVITLGLTPPPREDRGGRHGPHLYDRSRGRAHGVVCRAGGGRDGGRGGRNRRGALVARVGSGDRHAPKRPHPSDYPGHPRAGRAEPRAAGASRPSISRSTRAARWP